MIKDNNLLIALSLLERIEPQLQANTRIQLNRSVLDFIKQVLSQALDRLNRVFKSNGNIYILGDLIVSIQTVDALLADDNFTETDLSTKELLAEKIDEALGMLYVECGKYYIDHDFEYKPYLDDLLKRIVDACVESGIYFGEEVGLLEGAK